MGFTVLLAEDNAVNRKLATSLLEKHGYSVIVTENGRAALEALEAQRVDAVLMDVQMPVMDGIESIRAIRKKEQRTGNHLPIIALTAHAMKGDRERCLEAGADEYLTKPIRSAELIAALGRVGDLTPRTSCVDSAKPELPSEPAWDMAAALERVEGDRELVEELASLFLEECPKSLAEIRSALEAGDTVLLARLAHTTKGASANIGANAASLAARALESDATSGDLAKAKDDFKTLEAEINRLLPELEAVAQKLVP